MPSEIVTVEHLNIEVTFTLGPARPAEIAVVYDGTKAPVELFSHLAAVGFPGLVPQPPPPEAIDWSHSTGSPDEAPQVRPYRAASSTQYSGPIDQHNRAVDAAHLIVERLVAAGTHVEAPPPKPLRGPTPPSGPRVDVEIVADAGHAARLRTALEGYGVIVEDGPTVWTAKIRYRGVASETQHRAVRFVVATSPEGERSLMRALSTQPVRSVTTLEAKSA